MTNAISLADLPDRQEFIAGGPAAFWTRTPDPVGPRAVRFGEGLLLLRFEDCRAAFADRRLVQGNLALLEAMPDVDPAFLERRRRAILDMEGADHVRLRRLAMPALSPAASDAYRSHAAEIIGGLVDRVVARGRCDAVTDLCQPYPIPVMTAVLGVAGEDIAFFSRCAEAWTRWIRHGPAAISAAMAAHNEMDDYLSGLVARRREALGEDMISDLIRAEEDGDRLTAHEIIHLIAALVVAATDTTRFSLASGLCLFANHPDQWDQLAADPSLAVGAAEEVLRYAPVAALLRRSAAEDLEIAGVAVPRGTTIFLSPAVANHDPEAFPDPECFTIHRPITRPNLTFGAGRKHCLGSHLARAELQEALVLLSQRLPHLDHDGPATWAEPLAFFQGPTSLPIRWSPPGHR
jgi:cytochrome P450